MAAVWEIRSKQLLEAAAFCTGVPGTQAHSGGLVDHFGSWVRHPPCRVCRSLPYKGTAHDIDINNIPQKRHEDK